MKVDVNMTTDEDKLHINAWWAKTPEFAVEALRRHLQAAAVIWPELKDLRIGTIATPDVDQGSSRSPQVSDGSDAS
jgi:hypothetical protein